MWIKICGNTNLDDATLATELGADALGFVFAPSPRRTTPQQVAAIIPHLPPEVEKIGVFSTLDFDEIAATIRTAGLTGAQLHGGFSSALIASLAYEFPALRIIQTTHWNVDPSAPAVQTHAAALATFRATPHIDAVLVDSRTATASGGTGIAFDWNAARTPKTSSGLSPSCSPGGSTLPVASRPAPAARIQKSWPPFWKTPANPPNSPAKRPAINLIANKVTCCN
jgi:phosphoribosylanthranilate isomerase